MSRVLAVALGAGLGAPTRYLVDEALRRRCGDRLPWGLLVVNLLGAAVAGLVAGLALGSPAAALLAVGFCGAFTTASALAADLLERWDGDRRSAAVVLGLHLVGGLGLAAAGVALGRALA